VPKRLAAWIGEGTENGKRTDTVFRLGVGDAKTWQRGLFLAQRISRKQRKGVSKRKEFTIGQKLGRKEETFKTGKN